MSNAAPATVACPYCTEKIAADAIVCRFCQRDLIFFMPLRRELQALRERLDDQQEQNRRLAQLVEKLIRRRGGNDDDLIDDAAHITDDAERTQAASTAEGEAGGGTLPRPAAAAGPGAPGRVAIALLIALPVIALWLAHGLIVMLFDLNPLILRAASIAIPALLGLAFTLRHRISLPRQALAGVVIAALAVAGMTAVVSWVDEQPFLPQNIVEWREVVNYMLSIAFSHLTGVFAGLLIARQRNRSVDKLSRVLANALSAGDHSPGRAATVRRHAESIKDVLTVVAPIVTTLISITTGVMGLLKK
jgi:hypothetical protein